MEPFEANQIAALIVATAQAQYREMKIGNVACQEWQQIATMITNAANLTQTTAFRQYKNR